MLGFQRLRRWRQVAFGLWPNFVEPQARRYNNPNSAGTTGGRSGVSAERRKLPQGIQMAAFSRKPLRRRLVKLILELRFELYGSFSPAYTHFMTTDGLNNGASIIC
jgi:hypothetical protein